MAASCHCSRAKTWNSIHQLKIICHMLALAGSLVLQVPAWSLGSWGLIKILFPQKPLKATRACWHWDMMGAWACWSPLGAWCFRGCWEQQGPGLSGMLEPTDLRVSQRPVFVGGHRGHLGSQSWPATRVGWFCGLW